jgi:hypothetical protein
VKGVAARSEFVDAIVNKGKSPFSKENKDFPEKVNNYGVKQIREGCPTPEDIAYLSTRIINGDHPHAQTMADVPNNVAYTVYHNLDQTAINNGIFAKHIKETHSADKSTPAPKHTLIIRSDDMAWKTNGKPFSACARHTIWTECKDTDVMTGGKTRNLWTHS